MAADTIVNVSVFCKISNEAVHREKLLNEKRVGLIKFLADITNGYIWQKDAFSLYQESSSLNKSGKHACLNGAINCGENIEDEWFIVYILFQMSIQDEEIIISVTDNDGEFLLIEAADYIPRWLKPDTSENRVFIHKGKLHIIPLPSNPSELALYPAGKPLLEQSIQIIFENHGTEASEQIQNSISLRMRRFEDGFSHLFHNAYCFVTQKLGYILHKEPSIANKILDSLDQYLAANFNKQNKESFKFPIEDCAISRVSFTRYTYAKLLHMSIGKDLPLPSMKRNGKSISQNAYELGYKLMCGYHLLCGELNSTSRLYQDFGKTEQKLAEFEESLKKLGYFKGEIEGSKKWQDLHGKAKAYFLASLPDENEKTVWENKHLLSLIEESKTQTFSTEQLLPEDDDSWLALSVDDVENLLRGHCPETSTTREDASSKLDDVVQNMRKFVNRSSDYEGVETEQDHIEFDPVGIIEELKKIIDVKPDYEDSNDSISDDSDQYDSADDAGISDEMNDVISSMEQELRGTTLGKSFQTSSNKDKSDENSRNIITDQAVDSDDRPLDIDFNLVKNFLESFSAQQGVAGPVSNILNSMGIALPPEDADSE